MPPSLSGSCTICDHPESARLLSELPQASLRDLERRYAVSRSALQRHRLHGCKTARGDTNPQREETPPSGALQPVVALLTEIRDLLTTLAARQSAAEEDGATRPQDYRLDWNRL